MFEKNQDQRAAQNWMTTAILSQVHTGFAIGASLHGFFFFGPCIFNLFHTGGLGAK